MSNLDKKSFKVTTNIPRLPDIDDSEETLNLFDQENPDINLFNMVDDEIIRLSGSKILIYQYRGAGQSYDDVYMEERNKVVDKTPIETWGFYEPQALDEELNQFGLTLTNDQLFQFNKAYIEQKLGRGLIPGDVVQPKFQNMKFEIFQVVEDSFESYGVYHLVCSARLLRDGPTVQDQPLLDKSKEIGGYSS